MKVPLIFCFLTATLNLFFFPNFGLNWYLFILEIALDKLEKLFQGFKNVCGCLALNKMQIEVAPLIVLLINYNLTYTLSKTPPDVKKSICI